MIKTIIEWHNVKNKLPTNSGVYLTYRIGQYANIFTVARFATDLQKTDGEEAFAKPNCHEPVFYVCDSEWGDTTISVDYWAELPDEEVFLNAGTKS